MIAARGLWVSWRPRRLRRQATLKDGAGAAQAIE